MVPLSAPPASYAAAVERYLTGAGIAKSSARNYLISLTTWGWMFAGEPAPTGPARRGAKPPVFQVATLDDPVLPEVLAELATARADEMDGDTVNRELSIARSGAMEWIHWQSGTAQLLPRLIARRTCGPLFRTGRRAPAGTPSLDVCEETGRARLSYRRAEEIFEENTRLLANLLASPRTPRTPRTWTAGPCTGCGTPRSRTTPRAAPPPRCCWPAPGTPPSAPWRGTPALALTPSPGMSLNATLQPAASAEPHAGTPAYGET
ncbi:hypothetical protein ACWD5R_44660 [Streptomyces sp. NPDC002514]|uniref:hypothetical protein n=1 Tax=Streptomyces sp. NPDC001270 TaxID=3364554 RepID=UPI003673D2CB